MRRTLDQGARVTFTLVDEGRGSRASNVTGIGTTGNRRHTTSGGEDGMTEHTAEKSGLEVVRDVANDRIVATLSPPACQSPSLSSWMVARVAGEAMPHNAQQLPGTQSLGVVFSILHLLNRCAPARERGP
jgi:hypothetical protein